MARGTQQPRLPAGARLIRSGGAAKAARRPRPGRAGHAWRIAAAALLFPVVFPALPGAALAQDGSAARPAVTASGAPPIIDDATLQREYRDYLASVAGLRRYEVGYIRVPDEALARRLIAQIRSGARFEEMARKHSTHAESATRGGALGNHAGCRWARATREMLDSLKPGQTWPQPVKGTHGWGIYRLVSVADVVPRSFEQYRSELLSGTFEPECPWEPPASVRTAPAGRR